MVKEKIKQRMDKLQNWMESNRHLSRPEEVYDLTKQVSKFWSVLSEEDKDYIQAAQTAIEEQLKWKIDWISEKN